MQDRLTHERKLFLGWMLVILFTAVGLRLFAFSHVPPGLTHDEADHGITAVSILEGARDIYFTVGHGREPLYDYVTAVVMAGIGRTYLAGRLTAVFFSLLTIAGMAAWVRRAFDWQTAVLTAAGLAVSFWPLMAARQSLRSIALPALFVLAVTFFWRGLAGRRMTTDNGQRAKGADNRLRMVDYGMAGFFLGLTFYTYIPARVLWLVFPLVWGYVMLAQRKKFAAMWRGVLLMLVVAAVIGLSLFLHLAAHPEAEIRIRELSGPLTAVTQGRFTLLWQNMREGVGILFWRGDDFWRYNLPGRPLLGPVMALLSGGGLVLASWWAARPFVKRQPDVQLRGAACFLGLCWLFIGLLPVLVTGASLSTTQAMGLQPVLFLFPALAIRALGNPQITQIQQINPGGIPGTILFKLIVVLLFAATAVRTSRDYFITWANAPEVRVQYEATQTAVMQYINEQGAADTAVSTITPGQYHTPALARMMLTNEQATMRWFDGRTGLLIPHTPDALLVFSGFAPLSDALKPYLDTAVPIATLPQPASDLDQPLTVYQVNGMTWLADHPPAVMFDPPILFGEAAALVGYDLEATAVPPGGVLSLTTFWQLQSPVEDIRLFSHLVGADGVPVAQADLLAAPGEAWVSGDVLVQQHQMMLPADLTPGTYLLLVGWYTCGDAACQQTQRLLTPTKQDHFSLQEISITP